MYFFLWPCCIVCRILVLQPGIKLAPPAVEAWSPNHWTAKEFPLCDFFPCFSDGNSFFHLY